MFIDTHCHLDHKDYENDLERSVKRKLKKGVTQCVIPGADMKDLNRAIEISEKFEGVFLPSAPTLMMWKALMKACLKNLLGIKSAWR